MSTIRLRAGATMLDIALDATPTAAALLKALPFQSVAQTWGEEVYFEAPVSVTLEAGALQTVEPGTVCYWVEGSSVALPYGRTPISGKEGKPKLVSLQPVPDAQAAGRDEPVEQQHDQDREEEPGPVQEDAGQRAGPETNGLAQAP